MTTGLPAWVAICAVLTAQALPARADGSAGEPSGAVDSEGNPERRQVAVIDLTEQDSVRELIGKLYTVLNNHVDLKTPNKRGFDTALTGRFYDEDHEHIATARKYLLSAQGYLDVEANAPTAVSQARLGQAELAQVVPTIQVQSLYADLSLVIGLALLDEGRSQEAAYALALVHRIEPLVELDPARYPPDSVAAFKHASEAKPPVVALEIKGTGHVWIDFVDRGSAPATFEAIEVGEHCITVSGADRMTTPVLPFLPKSTDSPDPSLPPRPGLVKASATITVRDANADDMVKVERLRLALSRAQTARDDVARAGAIRRLAEILQITDVVLISKRADGKLQWETWRDRAPGFSAPQAYTNQKPEDMLEGLAPPHPPVSIHTIGPPPFLGPIAVEQQWYEKGWVQISGATGVILVIVGIILLSTRDHPISFGNGDIKVFGE
ncbi:MAG: hypothetical protein ABI591_31870 [Kofleriaceae bacterium]